MEQFYELFFGKLIGTKSNGFEAHFYDRNAFRVSFFELGCANAVCPYVCNRFLLREG